MGNLGRPREWKCAFWIKSMLKVWILFGFMPQNAKKNKDLVCSQNVEIKKKGKNLLNFLTINDKPRIFCKVWMCITSESYGSGQKNSG